VQCSVHGCLLQCVWMCVVWLSSVASRWCFPVVGWCSYLLIVGWVSCERSCCVVVQLYSVVRLSGCMDTSELWWFLLVLVGLCCCCLLFCFFVLFFSYFSLFFFFFFFFFFSISFVRVLPFSKMVFSLSFFLIPVYSKCIPNDFTHSLSFIHSLSLSLPHALILSLSHTQHTHALMHTPNQPTNQSLRLPA
jgi:hypothetical protein